MTNEVKADMPLLTNALAYAVILVMVEKMLRKGRTWAGGRPPPFPPGLTRLFEPPSRVGTPPLSHCNFRSRWPLLSAGLAAPGDSDRDLGHILRANLSSWVGNEPVTLAAL